MSQAVPYSRLAPMYDYVMAHIDYAFWAEHIFDLIQEFNPKANSVLELGCGTAALASELIKLGAYDYSGSDLSESMIEVARKKVELRAIKDRLSVADFRVPRVGDPVDVVLLLFDGMNYNLDEASIAATFGSAHDALKDGGVFIFDISTPANSINNADDFDDEGVHEGVYFVRTSKYDADSEIHETTFKIGEGEAVISEVHRQRAYTQPYVHEFIDPDLWEDLAILDGFTHESASPETERIHWVLRKRGDERNRSEKKDSI